MVISYYLLNFFLVNFGYLEPNTINPFKLLTRSKLLLKTTLKIKNPVFLLLQKVTMIDTKKSIHSLLRSESNISIQILGTRKIKIFIIYFL